jgi:hypothetical protein
LLAEEVEILVARDPGCRTEKRPVSPPNGTSWSWSTDVNDVIGDSSNSFASFLLWVLIA